MRLGILNFFSHKDLVEVNLFFSFEGKDVL